MKRKMWLAVLLVSLACIFTGCMSTREVKQYGLEDEDTIALNLTRNPNVGTIFVTHVNGKSTGAGFSSSGLFSGKKETYVNPIYIKLNGRPIVFTISCPVVVGYDDRLNEPIVRYRSTELRLTKLADIKAGMAGPHTMTICWFLLLGLSGIV